LTQLNQFIDNHATLQNFVSQTQLLAASTQPKNQTWTVKNSEGKTVDVAVKILEPVRIQLSLTQVVPDLFTQLEPILGKHYADNAPYATWLKISNDNAPSDALLQLQQNLPVLEHNPEITFHLRKNITFHDGHALTAADVEFTYQAIMSSKNLSPRTADFEPIKTVEILNDHSLKVTYKRLFSPAIHAWTMGILPKHLLSQIQDLRADPFNRQPIGSGAFVFQQWQSDELIHLRRNEQYWEGKPWYKHFYYRIMPDMLTQEIEFRTGALDSYHPQPHQMQRYQNDKKYQAYTSLARSYVYIGYNNRKAPFNHADIRRALGMALNIDEIIQYVLYGQGERVTGPYPKNVDWYNPDVPPLPYDPLAAADIFAQQGWQKNAQGWLEKDGKIFEFNLISNNGNAVRKAVMTIAQNAWRKIGVKCNTQVFEWAVFLEDFVNKNNFDALVLGWNMDAGADLYQLWHSSQSQPNQLNFVGYSNPEADRLIEQIRQEYQHAKQVKLTHALHEIIAQDQPYTFLHAPRTSQILDKKIMMLDAEGNPSSLRTTQSGELMYYFNQWRQSTSKPSKMR
jgi:ABC-type transport system substrate-binding protein